MKFAINFSFKCHRGIGNDSKIIEADIEQEARTKIQRIFPEYTQIKIVRIIADRT